MQFQEGATVTTADGRKLGEVERFVVDPSARRISALVIRKGLLLPEDKVVPITRVANATANQVTLLPEVESADDLASFEEMHYVHAGSDDARTLVGIPFNGPLFYMPPSDLTAWHGSAYPPAYSPEVVTVGRNVPEGTVPVQEGARVVTRDGEAIGDISRIFTHPDNNEVTHIAIGQGTFFREEKLLPANWIDVAKEGEIRLAVSRETLEKVADF